MGQRIPRFLLVLIFLVLIGFLVEGLYYFQITQVKKQTTKIASPLQQTNNTSQKFVATANIDVFLKPGQNKVGYLVSGQTFTMTPEQQAGYIKIIDSSNYQLWIKEGSAYKQAESK